MPYQEFVHKIKQNNLSLTSERKNIFKILYSQSEPLSISHLLKLCPDINKSTVYRTLDIFEKLEITTRIYNGWKYRIELTEKYSNHHHHHHLNCSVCGKTESFTETRNINSELTKISEKKDFYLRTHTLELFGICSACQTTKQLKELHLSK